MNRIAITTIDNPFDPIDEFDNWYMFDESKGYHTCSFLARLAPIREDMSIDEYYQVAEETIDEIIKQNLFPFYKKVVKAA